MAELFLFIVIDPMKRTAIMLAVAVFAIVLVLFKLKTAENINNSQDFKNVPPARIEQNNPALIDDNIAAKKDTLAFPIDRPGERVTKKPFGIYITSQNSPVNPERFSGYHTGTDFETSPEEQNSNVPVFAITSGKIILEKWAGGYGGVLAESAEINGQPVTIIYGHLDLASLNKKTGDSLNAGEQIGFLGKGYSQQTDGERKHLHLGIYKGSTVSILGYVQNKNDLGQWIEPLSIFNF